MTRVAIPVDLYESPREIVIIMPLGGVQKKSIELFFDNFSLVIKGTRVRPKYKADLVIQQEECYWGDFEQIIQLPPHVYFEQIHSVVSPENVLTITVPKSLQPGKMKLDVKIENGRVQAK